MNALAAATAYFIFVFFKALQQRNVAFLHYRWVLPASIAMGLVEVFVHSLVALNVFTNGVDWRTAGLGLAIGVGGGVGALCAMKIHTKYLPPKEHGK